MATTPQPSLAAAAPWKHDPAKELDVHPLANVIPPMTEAEYEALVKSIEANGLQVPITIHEGKILDGRHRYRAMIKIGKYKLKDESFRVYEGSNPLQFVLDANVRRRHLNASQLALIGADLVTTKLGYNQHMVGITNEKAAKMLNVSEANIKKAKDVLEKGAPEVIEAVRKGKKRLGAVNKFLDKPKAEQAQQLLTTKPDKPNKPKANPVNPEMVEFDEFKKKWQSFNEMQKRAFVMFAKDDLDKLLQQVKQQEALIGAAA
jgi:ParB-like chromosome segregation protein Spo0J